MNTSRSPLSTACTFLVSDVMLKHSDFVDSVVARVNNRFLKVDAFGGVIIDA